MSIIDWIFVPLAVIGAVCFLIRRLLIKTSGENVCQCAGCPSEGSCDSMKRESVEECRPG